MWKHTSLSLVFVGVACGGEMVSEVAIAPAADVRIQAILGLVNDPSVSADELDHGVKLDSRAATNIVELRPFATIEELDAVPYVGPTAVERLFHYAAQHGYLSAYQPPVEIVMPPRDDVRYEQQILLAVLEDARISDADAVLTRAKLRFDDGDLILTYEELAQAAFDCRTDVYAIEGYRFAESAVRQVMEAFELEDRLALLSAGTSEDADENRYLTLEELERARLRL
jgi:hypothetical protein